MIYYFINLTTRKLVFEIKVFQKKVFEIRKSIFGISGIRMKTDNVKVTSR